MQSYYSEGERLIKLKTFQIKPLETGYYQGYYRQPTNIIFINELVS